jgi:cell division protein ZapA
MQERRVAIVKILDEEYRIHGDSNPEEISRLASYVDHAIRQLMKASPVTDPKRLAILASVNIAQELFQERTEASQYLGQLQEKAESLSRQLDGLVREGVAGKEPGASLGSESTDTKEGPRLRRKS